MKNIIITACDEKYGDFLINHWLKSLKDNVDLKNIDVAVIDYGLNKKQKEILKKEKVILIKKKKSGQVGNIRIKDCANWLKNKRYKYVLFCDGWDIIFQTDLKELFDKKPKKPMLSYDDSNLLFQPYINPVYFRLKNIPKIQKMLLKKRMLNVGVIFGPKKEIIKLFEKSFKLIKNKNYYGAEQIAINYFAYKEGFEELDQRFNCMPLCTKIKFHIKEGKFYDEKNNIIPIIHNAGKEKFIRGIKNFGYGKNHNKLKTINRLISKAIFFLSSKIVRHQFSGSRTTNE
ncbi:MAG: hypothetical protein QXX68_01745 [Candidatus Pacearchaeota archaeon]